MPTGTQQSGTRQTQNLPDDIAKWNATTTDYPRDALLTDLFAAAVERTPDAPALTWSAGEWSYRELRDQVRRAACHLRARGVGEGEVVAVLLERSAHFVVAALAVLEAGAVYLPLDPDHPEARLVQVLEDSEAGHVITAQDCEIPDTVRATRVPVDDMAGHELPSPDTTWTEGRGAPDPAYVIYTSGSTGTPKGVVCTHRGLVRLVHADDPSVPGADDRLLATTNPTFDVSCYEIFCTLLNGACLVIPDPDDLLDSEDLARTLRRRRITTLWLSAGLFHRHAEAKPEMFGSLRCLMAGGDVLNPSAVRAVLEHGGPRVFLNGYGPSENAVMSTTHRIDRLSPHAELVPIGRPVANTTAYVVRHDGDLAAPGEEGELWLGGDGVALGYLNDPGKTAQRFVPDPFGSDPRARLYRTGDVVRQRRDGVLEFLGRRDRQVKIRGFRVELDEVEAVLTAHPQIAQAAADVIGQGAGERLGAAVVAVPGADTSGLDRRTLDHARDRLPAYMVPARLVVAEGLPLQSSGKPDRDQLLSLMTDRGETAGGEGDRGEGDRAQGGSAEGDRTAGGRAGNGAPLGREEETVAEIWGDLLGLGTPGAEDDFFALGGTSLRATQVAAATRQRFSIRPEHSRDLIRTLLDNPTLSAFTGRVRDLATATGQLPDAARPDFTADAALDPRLRFDAPPAPRRAVPESVLLTGGTGFLGVHVIDRLVQAGVRRVFCLTRAGDEAEGLARLAARMRRFALDPSACEDHLTPVPGELSEPRFGLDDTTWDRVARESDLILHAGSQVNFAYPYEALAPTNVGGTATVLELATAHTLKPVHYVSTIAVIAGFGTAGVRHVSEDTPLAHPDRISLGYPESKWVAESMVSSAAERGLPAAIHRPYEVTGTTGRGVWNTDTMMCALFRTIAETGIAPDIPLPLDFVPVDYTADVITRVLTHEEPDGRVYHITNPHDARLDLLVDRLRTMGYRVRTQPYDAWVDVIARLTADHPEHPMAPYIPMFIEPARDSGISVKEMYFAGVFPGFDRGNTERATAGSGIVCPPVDEHLIDLYLRYFRDSGFFPPPEAQTPVD
ncbi:amino acid adenylation domain-containing protein [Streptomyces iconiensis]|uniref:Amino acid adenylation domain-containing protein n=1 Tax=Streptomyces iconiensis TaxID=1384038 RepID=A0ABT7A4W5_9ACTN|nr:amino acid adenylation domain-containing protein [Streptomyces iconiensis]MDJ1135658.1 amino acid adenylation domain-containing protein [Streptomyces iconiensis]